MFHRESFIDGYVECAIWADCYPTEERLSAEGDDWERGKDGLIPTDELRTRMSEDCYDFIDGDDTIDLLAAYVALGRADGIGDEWAMAARAGHDFWLTRHGHGAGYWDRGLGKLGDELTARAKTYGESDVQPQDLGNGEAGVF